MKPPSEESPSLGGILLLAAVVITSVLAAGSVHPVVLVSVAAATAVGVAVLRPSPLAGGMPPPGWVLLALGIWSAVQALPLPVGILEAISPRNADVWSRALHPMGEPGPRYASISLDPGASWVEAAKWTLYSIVFAVAASVGRERGARAAPALAFGAAVVVALVTLVHGLVGAKALFGVYLPRFAEPRWGVAPLLNPNNLAGYLNLGAIAGAGLLIGHHRRSDATPFGWAVAAGVSLIVAVSVLAASRGGVLALALGLLALALGSWLLRRRLRRQAAPLFGWRPFLPLLVAVVGGGLLVFLGGSEATWRELHDKSVQKIELLSWSTPLIRAHPWLGVGRGAFETSFPAFRQGAGHVVFSYPENFVIQWAAEWGLPVAVVAIVALLWMLRPGRLGVFTDRGSLAVWVGVGVLLLHNLLDLALEVPGVMVLATSVLGVLWGSQNRVAPRSVGRRAWRRRVRPLALPALLVGLSWIAWKSGRVTAAERRAHLHAVFEATDPRNPEAHTPFAREMRDAMLRSPGDPYPPLLGANMALRTPGGNAMRWITATLERDPMSSRAHLLLAGILASRGAVGQALMEVRVSVELEGGLAAPGGQMAVRWSRDFEQLQRAAPEGRAGASVLVSMAVSLDVRTQADLRARLLGAAMAKDGTFPTPHVVRAQDLVGEIERKESRCTPASRCAEPLAAALRSLESLAPRSCHQVMVRARLAAVDGNRQEADALLRELCGGCDESLSCLQLRVQNAAAYASGPELKDAVRAYVGLACTSHGGCGDAHTIAGSAHAGRGEWGTAAEHYALALTYAADAPAYLRLARAAVGAGNSVQAESAVRQAERLGAPPTEVSRIREELNRLRAGALPVEPQ